jgi:membrane protease YdiL (CAAX protease family)
MPPPKRRYKRAQPAARTGDVAMASDIIMDILQQGFQVGVFRRCPTPGARNLPPTPSARDIHEKEELAPLWHTATLVFVIVGVALTGTLLSRYKDASPVAAPVPERLLALYLPSVLVNVGLVLYVSRIGRGRSFLGELIGTRWPSFGRAGTDLLLASLGWMLIELGEIASARLFGPSTRASGALLPTTPTERLGWWMFAMSAGFCEEVVYRGYLRTQLGARTTATLGIVLQAILFGVAHADQGWAALRLGIYGLGLGLLARYRGSLIPAILCHIGIDLASGLWLR